MSRRRVVQRPAAPGEPSANPDIGILGPAPIGTQRPLVPSTVIIGHWYHHGFQLQATCSCGRSSIVHMGNLIIALGDGFHFNDHSEGQVSKMLTCIRCGKRGPALTVVKG